MSGLDLFLIGFIVLGLVRGFMNGLFVEIASLIALVAGVYGALHFSNYAATFIDENSQWDEQTVNITAFAVTFVIIVLVIALAGKALTKLADFAALGIVNKLLGALFGAVKITLILSVILNIYDSLNRAIPLTDQKTMDDSALYHPVKSMAPSIFPIILEKKRELEDTLQGETDLEVEQKN